MSEKKTKPKQTQPPKEERLSALSQEELTQVERFFQQRLIGQPEVVQALCDVLYKQNALLKRLLDSEDPDVDIPHDPSVLLLLGGSWGKSLAARLMPMALERLGHGALSILTPLPQDSEGRLNFDPQVLSIPFATLVLENVEAAQHMNARFVANLAHLLDAGVVSLLDAEQQTVNEIPLGLCTLIMTSNIADERIREELAPESRLGFSSAQEGPTADAEELYAKVQEICEEALDLLPRELMRKVDQTLILRPLSTEDLRQIFELEIVHYQRNVFPGHQLALCFEPGAKEYLFTRAQEGLEVYGSHALRRVLQKHIDAMVYRAYNRGDLSEENLSHSQVVVSLEENQIKAHLAPYNA